MQYQPKLVKDFSQLSCIDDQNPWRNDIEKIFAKNMYTPWSRGKDSWLWIERSRVWSPNKPQEFFYTPFLTILHTVKSNL